MEEKKDGPDTGYAQASSVAFEKAQKATFHKHAKACDIIITTAAIPGRASPVLLEDYMVADMKPGSVIIDLGAVGGGNCTMTKKGETIVTPNGVTIVGELDFPSKMAPQASQMYAQNMLNLVDHIGTADASDKEFSAAKVLANLQKIAEKNMSEVVCDQVICGYNGEVVQSPPPPSVTVAPPKIAAPETTTEKVEIAKAALVSNSVFVKHYMLMFYVAVVMFLVALLDNEILIQLMMVFMLAAWVGYMLVYGVHPALHTPLMSVSNAISGQVILGGIFMVSSKQTGTAACASAATFIAAINVAGGFVVTAKMLKMYVKEK